MRNFRRATVVALCLVVCMLLAAARPSQAQGAASAAQWPHTITTENASVLVYQPQAISWPDHETLTARAALAITRRGEKTPIIGTVEVSFATRTDAATDQVVLSDPQLVASHFPALDTGEATQLEARIRQGLPQIATRSIALRTVLLSLKEHNAPASLELPTDPPAIFHSASPASLVVFDGEPVLAPVGKTGLSFAVNTNWDVFTDGKDWYLLNNGLWLAAASFTGPYKLVTKLPPAFQSMPADKNFADVRKAIPPRPGKPAVVPAIFVSTKPAEIIVTQGPPQFVPVTGTGLQSIKNTTSILMFEPASGRFFLLISGRWFASQGLDGPWTYASNSLPPDFSLIPPNGPQAPVLAAVPGTAQAQLAVLQAQVPKQGTLQKNAVKLAVVYAGAPQFKPIPGTTMTYAVNTSFEVIETGGRYFVCYEGAWYVGATPNGPWALAEAVPAVIYTIPPSSPLYNVTYVKVYATTPTTVVYGYTAGYTMSFVSAGVVVYGTGYYYPPVVIPAPIPIYYPAPYSYAGGVWYNSTTGTWHGASTIYGPYGGVATHSSYYNPSTGAWASGGAIYGPNGGAGAFSAYNPSTGSYAHGSAAWGGGSGSANASYYNARTGISGSTSQNWNPYQRTGSSTFSGQNQTVNTKSGTNAQGSAGGFKSSTGAEGAGYSGANGNKGGAVKTQNGDVYAGHDGNVYQHTSDGWSKWSDGGWQPVTPPTPPNGNGNGNSNGNRLQSGSGTQSGSLGASQGGASSSRQRLGASGGSAGGGSRQTMDGGTWQDLEQDRQARSSDLLGGARGGGGFGGRFRR
jgi:hypothetical protein